MTDYHTPLQTQQRRRTKMLGSLHQIRRALIDPDAREVLDAKSISYLIGAIACAIGYIEKQQAPRRGTGIPSVNKLSDDYMLNLDQGGLEIRGTKL